MTGETRTPSFKSHDTYSGWTQDVIRLIHEASERGATEVRIRNEKWNVTVIWMPQNGSSGDPE